MMQVQHVLGESAVQSRAVALEHEETAPRDLGPAYEIDDVQVLGQLEVLLRYEIETFALHAPGPDGLVVLGGRANGDTGVRDVGEVEHHIRPPGVQLQHRCVYLLDPLGDPAHLRDHVLLLIALQTRDRLRGPVPLVLEAVALIHELPPFPVDPEELIEHLLGVVPVL